MSKAGSLPTSTTARSEDEEEVEGLRAKGRAWKVKALEEVERKRIRTRRHKR